MRILSIVLAGGFFVAITASAMACPSHTAHNPPTLASADGKLPISTPTSQPTGEPRS
jgi:hypothetical protein